MSGVFMDGGGADSLTHGGDGMDHGGHDHGSHGVQHGHGQGGHSFLAQILGLDQQDHAHLAHHGGEGMDGQQPSQTPAWNSALQGLKLENLLAGINITPNFLLFMLFASFIGWLGVIYWIRHHEPFANTVLGSSAAFAPTVGADRRLINDCRDALPIKTSAQSGVVYSPQPGQNSSQPPSGSPVNDNLSNAMRSIQIPGAAQPQMQAVAQPQMQAAAPSYASTPVYQASPPSSSPVNSTLSAAMGANAAPAAAGYAPAVSYAPTPAYQASEQNISPVNNTLSAAMGAGAAAPANATGSYAPASAAPSSYMPVSGSAVNSNLSAAMSSALGPAPAAPATAPQQTGYAQPAAQAGYGQPAYNQAAYPMAQQMPPQSIGPGMGAPAASAGGSMRLFSSRRSLMAQSMGPAPAQSAPPQYGQSAQAQYPQSAAPLYAPAPAAAYAPVAAYAPAPANANTWSLANQGTGSFSADTAQFNSQFGAPLERANSFAPPAPAAGLPAGSYPVSTAEGTRLKVVTDK